MSIADDVSKSLDTTAVAIFPWADARLVQPWVSDATNSAPDSGGSTAQLAEFAKRAAAWITDYRADDKLAFLLPSLPESTNLLGLHLSARMKHALTARGARQFSDVAELSPLEILRWRQVGIGSARSLVAQLLMIAIADGARVPVATEPASPAVPAWTDSAVAALQTIARWNYMLGRPHSSLLTSDHPSLEPLAVKRARDLLERLSARDIHAVSPISAADLLGASFAKLDPRGVAALRERTFADSPITLDALGQKFDVTRERMRQIEKRASDQLRDQVSSSDLGAVQRLITDQIGSLARLDRLLQVLPPLRERVDVVDLPVWRILDRLDDDYEIRDGWCAIPSVRSRVMDTLSNAKRRSGDNAFALTDELSESLPFTQSLERDDAESWYRYCGLEHLLGHWFLPPVSVADRASIILDVEGEPLNTAAILAKLGVDRSAGALKNAMSVDSRFARVNRDSWALSAWGLTAYKSIRQLIATEVDEHGGSIEVTTLVDNLTTKFNVKPASVMIYASSHPFQTQNGRISRASSQEGSESSKTSVWRTPRVFRRASSWLLRTRVTEEHLRGSGSTVPASIAHTMRLDRGTSRLMATRDGDQLFSWKSLQPTLGSVRRLLAGTAVDDVVFFVFGPGDNFDVEPSRRANGTIDEALALAGLPSAAPGTGISQLGQAIGLAEDAGFARVISALREKRDDDLAELLETA